MTYELVGGPHCGATVETVGAGHGRDTTVWLPGAPSQYGVNARPHTNAPASGTDVAYAYDVDRRRYVYAGVQDAPH